MGSTINKKGWHRSQCTHTHPAQSQLDNLESCLHHPLRSTGGFSSVAQLCLTLQSHGLQHASPPCSSPTPRVYSSLCPSSRWCHPTISSSVVPFSSHLQSFPASGLFKWVSSSHQVSKVLEFQLQHQSFQWVYRTYFLEDGLLGSPCNPRDSQESSPTPQFKSINSSMLSFLYSPNLTSIHDYWKNHSLDEMDLCWQSNVSAFNMLSRSVITFLPRRKSILISWLHSPSAVILEHPKIKSVTVSTPSVCHEVMVPDAMILVFWMLSFKTTFSLSSFTFIKRFFGSSSLSALMVVSSA